MSNQTCFHVVVYISQSQLQIWQTKTDCEAWTSILHACCGMLVKYHKVLKFQMLWSFGSSLCMWSREPKFVQCDSLKNCFFLWPPYWSVRCYFSGYRNMEDACVLMLHCFSLSFFAWLHFLIAILVTISHLVIFCHDCTLLANLNIIRAFPYSWRQRISGASTSIHINVSWYIKL